MIRNFQLASHEDLQF